jgi:hypothetical protein
LVIAGWQQTSARHERRIEHLFSKVLVDDADVTDVVRNAPIATLAIAERGFRAAGDGTRKERLGCAVNPIQGNLPIERKAALVSGLSLHTALSLLAGIFRVDSSTSQHLVDLRRQCSNLGHELELLLSRRPA